MEAVFELEVGTVWPQSRRIGGHLLPHWGQQDVFRPFGKACPNMSLHESGKAQATKLKWFASQQEQC